MKDFRELILAHTGKRICVIGGAPVDELPEADVYISTNGHGVHLRQPDYLLAMDERNSREQVPMGVWLRGKSTAPIISPHGYADYRLGNWPQNPRFVLSGMIATWMAFLMGAKVVILAGFDAYGGEAGYIEEARKINRDVHCPVRVAGGGPLTKVWPNYETKERFVSDKPHTAIEGWQGIDGRVRVRARKPCTVGQVDLAIGDELTTVRHEVARLLKHRMVEEIDLPEDTAPAPAELTAAQLKEKLTELGVEFKGNASKAALQELYDAAVSATAEPAADAEPEAAAEPAAE